MLLSVVIPTKNRPGTLYHAVRAALAIPSSDMEVVVQDCSDDTATKDVLFPFLAEERLRYERSSGAPSMTENWNLAFARVRGDYAVVIGDDDAVGREISNAARWASENDADAIADGRLTYFWPNYQLREVAGTVRVTRHVGGVTFDDAQQVLKRSLRGYPVNPSILPHVYQGLVRMSLMYEIRRRTGTFFDSMAPDYYSTVALSCIASRFAVTTYPLCAAGASAAANSGRMHDGTDRLHSLEYRESDWSRYVPPFYCMTTTIVDAALKALSHMGRHELIPSLDYARFYADCLAQRPTRAVSTLRELRRLIGEQPSLGRAITTRLAPLTLLAGGHRLRHRLGLTPGATALKRLKSRLHRVDYDVLPAQDIVEALDKSRQLLESRGVTSPFALS